jgi:uncharacterized DUF497 family protein
MMQRYIRDFEWDDRNLEHIAEHEVDDCDVEFVILFDEPHFRGAANEKYAAYGVTQEGRYLFVIFCVKGEGLIRVITARDMAEREKRYYNERR